jgi:hypothetical protein
MGATALFWMWTRPGTSARDSAFPRRQISFYDRFPARRSLQTIGPDLCDRSDAHTPRRALGRGARPLKDPYEQILECQLRQEDPFPEPSREGVTRSASVRRAVMRFRNPARWAKKMRANPGLGLPPSNIDFRLQVLTFRLKQGHALWSQVPVQVPFRSSESWVSNSRCADRDRPSTSRERTECRRASR